MIQVVTFLAKPRSRHLLVGVGRGPCATSGGRPQAKEIGFDRSLFERLMEIGKEKHTLARQPHGMQFVANRSYRTFSMAQGFTRGKNLSAFFVHGFLAPTLSLISSHWALWMFVLLGEVGEFVQAVNAVTSTPQTALKVPNAACDCGLPEPLPNYMQCQNMSKPSLAHWVGNMWRGHAWWAAAKVSSSLLTWILPPKEQRFLQQRGS